ncbi:hypothetical protein YC2023_098388 [Brassica napus]
MAPGRVPSVGLVPDRQFGNSSDDDPGGCAQSREGSSFHRVWGIVPRGSNTPSGFSTSFLLGLIGFSSDLWVLALLVDFESFLRSDPFRVYAEDWSPEWSFTGKMRYIILLLGTPYLARVFGVPRYLTTCGDDTCGSSPSSSWGMKLLWAKPAGAYELSADPRL